MEQSDLQNSEAIEGLTIIKLKTIEQLLSAFDWDLDGKNKPAVTVEFEIEYGDDSKLLAQPDTSDKQNVQAWIRMIFLILQKIHVFHGVPGGRN